MAWMKIVVTKNSSSEDETTLRVNTAKDAAGLVDKAVDHPERQLEHEPSVALKRSRRRRDAAITRRRLARAPPASRSSQFSFSPIVSSIASPIVSPMVSPIVRTTSQKPPLHAVRDGPPCHQAVYNASDVTRCSSGGSGQASPTSQTYSSFSSVGSPGSSPLLSRSESPFGSEDNSSPERTMPRSSSSKQPKMPRRTAPPISDKAVYSKPAQVSTFKNRTSPSVPSSKSTNRLTLAPLSTTQSIEALVDELVTPLSDDKPDTVPSSKSTNRLTSAPLITTQSIEALVDELVTPLSDDKPDTVPSRKSTNRLTSAPLIITQSIEALVDELVTPLSDDKPDICPEDFLSKSHSSKDSILASDSTREARSLFFERALRRQLGVDLSLHQPTVIESYSSMTASIKQGVSSTDDHQQPHESSTTLVDTSIIVDDLPSAKWKEARISQNISEGPPRHTNLRKKIAPESRNDGVVSDVRSCKFPRKTEDLRDEPDSRPTPSSSTTGSSKVKKAKTVKQDDISKDNSHDSTVPVLKSKSCLKRELPSPALKSSSYTKPEVSPVILKPQAFFTSCSGPEVESTNSILEDDSVARTIRRTNNDKTPKRSNETLDIDNETLDSDIQLQESSELETEVATPISYTPVWQYPEIETFESKSTFDVELALDSVRLFEQQFDAHMHQLEEALPVDAHTLAASSSDSSALETSEDERIVVTTTTAEADLTLDLFHSFEEQLQSQMKQLDAETKFDVAQDEVSVLKRSLKQRDTELAGQKDLLAQRQHEIALLKMERDLLQAELRGRQNRTTRRGAPLYDRGLGTVVEWSETFQEQCRCV